MDDMQNVSAADMDPFQQHNVSLSEVRWLPPGGSTTGQGGGQEAGALAAETPLRSNDSGSHSCGRQGAVPPAAVNPHSTRAPPRAGRVYDTCGAWRLALIDRQGRIDR
jgi:hypothetical protein